MDRFLRKAEVQKTTGLSNTTIWREEKAGRFPSRRCLSGRTTGWLESEVNEWMESRTTSAGDFSNLCKGGDA